MMDRALGFLVSALLGCLALFTLAVPARAGTVDCEAATGPVASAVCHGKTLPELDRQLQVSLGAAKAALSDGAICLSEDEARWEAEVRKPCGDNEDCLRRVYLERLAALNEVLPEDRRPAGLDLPQVPVLVTALPPAPEAKGEPVGGPFAVTGQLVEKGGDAEASGIAIRSLVGRTTVILPAAHANDGPAHAALVAAVKSAGDTLFRIEGNMNPTTGSLAMNKCRFVYRLPE